uniref:Perilipin 1 n=1 Tax=Sus scrofa TaxID=9823 RepID=A0A8D0TZ72_PIG
MRLSRILCKKPFLDPLLEQENVLQRVLQLPVVSGTCECFQKTYTSTKEAHPLVASVCNAYEKGIQSAGSLAAWSMEPVVRRLSTQCESSRHLEAACSFTACQPFFPPSISLSDSLYVCLPVCLSVCLSACLPNSLYSII